MTLASDGRLTRVRWAVRGVLGLGVAASVVANVLHAVPNPISQSIAAWPPLALLLTVELISRVPVHSRALAVARIAATTVIAGIAAWVSYWHMAGVAARYGETGAAPYLIPFSVDGLIVVASVCLVELAGRIRGREPVSAPVPAPGPVGIVLDYDRPIGPEPAQPAVEPPAPVDSLSTPGGPVRKRQPSNRSRVERAHRRTPDATDDAIAKRLDLSAKTVRRYRPKTAPEQVNGSVPDLAEVAR